MGKLLLSYEVKVATDDKKLAKKFMHPYVPSALVKEMSKIFVYQSKKSVGGNYGLHR